MHGQQNIKNRFNGVQVSCIFSCNTCNITYRMLDEMLEMTFTSPQEAYLVHGEQVTTRMLISP